MKPWERRIAPLGILSAGVLFVVAACLPLLKERPPNGAFIGVGVMFFVLGLVMLRRSVGPEPPG